MIDVTGISRIQQLKRNTVALEVRPVNVSVEGFMRFYIDCRITADEISRWSPQKITDFFAGAAQVVHAATNQRDDEATNG